MEPNTRRERDTFSKILSLPICTSCMPNVLSSRRVFQHPRKADFPTVRDSNVWDGKLHEISRLMHDRKYILCFHHPVNFCVHPCMGKRNMNIANEFQRVNSSVLSSKKTSTKVESVKDVLSGNWEILEKYSSYFLEFYFRFLTFSICVCDLYLIDNVVPFY